MTKLGVARILGECSLGGGCIGGGVEVAKIGGKIKAATKNLDQENKKLKEENTKYKKERDDAKKWAENLKRENDNFKEIVKYAVEHYNVINTKTGDKSALQSHARDAKHGIKDRLEKGGNQTFADSISNLGN